MLSLLFVHIPEVNCAGFKWLGGDRSLGYQAGSHRLWQQLMKKIFTSDNKRSFKSLRLWKLCKPPPSLLVKVALSTLLHQGLKVVGVLLHPCQQVVHYVTGFVFLVHSFHHPPVIQGQHGDINQLRVRKGLTMYDELQNCPSWNIFLLCLLARS